MKIKYLIFSLGSFVPKVNKRLINKRIIVHSLWLPGLSDHDINCVLLYKLFRCIYFQYGAFQFNLKNSDEYIIVNKIPYIRHYVIEIINKLKSNPDYYELYHILKTLSNGVSFNLAFKIDTITFPTWNINFKFYTVIFGVFIGHNEYKTVLYGPFLDTHIDYNDVLNTVLEMHKNTYTKTYSKKVYMSLKQYIKQRKFNNINEINVLLSNYKHPNYLYKYKFVLHEQCISQPDIYLMSELKLI